MKYVAKDSETGRYWTGSYDTPYDKELSAAQEFQSPEKLKEELGRYSDEKELYHAGNPEGKTFIIETILCL